MSDEIVLKVWRGDQNGGEEVEYRVPAEPGMVVLDALHYVQHNLAPDLAVRWNCKAAHCGSCSAEVNGFPKLLCKTRLDDYVGQEVHVRPMATFPVIKDLVTDVSWNYQVAKEIPLFDPVEPAPFHMQQIDADRVQEFHRCIECFLCQDTCHVLRNHNGKDKYFGPRFMVKIAEFEMHPLDGEDRVPLLAHEAGVNMCNVTKCCTEVCPQHIRITDNAIIPLKERVADRYYDPIKILFRRLSGKDQQKSAAKS
ncbi:succinate dehydrogenase and fumarate reductase iron-sulfur protein [Sulfobacillus acidophilus TPY]|uniref:Succinate dehydrogenase subunit B n=1 Tax=Sulfobacillus acidophilus (strain ATCC 700253 / DSM 10332 / NAL) TaxID=679936 RepID=G8TY86_SULAD|nr:succinate dehydrogenase and fumarate reductase iron-sulfur protein [Sulfobacillus acidophilus TPY]AEW05050.1 succinate dehydrogenase subunit B [Sulfobacillus acidophilus DSM 10332]